MKPNLNPEWSLSAKLEAYTDDDLAFKRELITLMINNLRELSQAVRQNEFAIFEAIAHKTKSTLTILEDAEINQLVADLRKLLKAGNVVCSKISELFFKRVDHLIKCLEDETPVQKAS
jgi:hypothetical protein